MKNVKRYEYLNKEAMTALGDKGIELELKLQNISIFEDRIKNILEV